MSEATGKGKAASADGDQAPEHNLTSSMTENTKRSIEIFSSPPFKFVVGPERTEFMIHSKLLERLSQPLHNLMNNGTMTESREHVACLKDIDTQTFSDFVDFAYAFASVSDSTLEVEKEADGWWGYGNFFDSLSTSCAKHRCTSIPEDVGTFHIACDTGQSHTSSDVIEALLQDQRDVTGIMSSLYGLAMNYVAEKDRKCDEGPRAYLTSAGKLYVFADRYLVGGLKLVALHKLRKDFFAVPYRFSEVPYSPRSVEDFLELLDLAFEDGITDEKDESRITDLQMLVILIALHKHEVLKESKAFWEALSHNSHIGVNDSSVFELTTILKVAGIIGQAWYGHDPTVIQKMRDFSLIRISKSEVKIVLRDTYLLGWKRCERFKDPTMRQPSQKMAKSR